MLQKVNLAAKLAEIPEYWNPGIVGELNDQHVKLARLKGEFVWHSHAEEDEAFLVLKGRLRMELRDGVIDLETGDMLIVPRGVQHRPVAVEEVHVLLFEPAGTVNTGDVEKDRTVQDPRGLI